MVIYDKVEVKKKVDLNPYSEDNLYKYDLDAYVGMTSIRYRDLPNWAKQNIKPPILSY